MSNYDNQPSLPQDVNYKINMELFGSLTKPELTLLDTWIDSAARHAVMARNAHGSFVWDGDSYQELSRLSGSIASVLSFKES